MKGLGNVDWQSVARLLSYPGIDPRIWCSLGIVDADTPQARSVQFTDDQGTPLPQPLVNVTLQPSGVEVSARVSSSVSGQGVGEWHPFVAGDEVMVQIPSGDLRMGCVITGRLSNAIDTHPTSIAGNDTTQNSIAFKRFTEPYIMESGTAIMLRVAPVGSYLSLDPTGNVTLQSGDGHYLAIHTDMVSLMTKDTSCIVQMDPAKKTTFLQAGATQLLLDSAGKSHFLTTGQLSITTSGAQALGHAITAEQALMLIEGFFTAFAAAIAADVTPLTGSSLAAFMTPPLLLTMSGLAVEAASLLALGPAAAAFASALQNPPDPSGSIPGVGRPGFLL